MFVIVISKCFGVLVEQAGITIVPVKLLRIVVIRQSVVPNGTLTFPSFLEDDSKKMMEFWVFRFNFQHGLIDPNDVIFVITLAIDCTESEKWCDFCRLKKRTFKQRGIKTDCLLVMYDGVVYVALLFKQDRCVIMRRDVIRV